MSEDGVVLPDKVQASFLPEEQQRYSMDIDAEDGDDADPDTTTAQTVAAALNESIKAYEKSMAEYSDFEESVLEKIGPDLATVLKELRDDPEAFAMSSNPLIQSLARRRTQVVSSKAKLGISEGRKRTKSFSAIPESAEEDGSSRLQSSKSKDRFNKRASWGGHVGSSSSAMLSKPKKRGGSPSTLPVALKESASNAEPSKLPLIQADGTEGNNGASDSTVPVSLSKMLSTKWAERLVDVNPTRGKLRETSSADGVPTYKIRPLWPEWLTDTTYTVVKKNKYGKRQKRIIKLTEYHFFNIKNGSTITRSFVYSDIKNVWLKTNSTLVVSFGDNLVYEYETSLAPVIAQQLATRSQVRMALDKVSSSVVVGHASVKNISKTTAALISSISEGNASAQVTPSIVSFARTISESFLSSRSERERGSSIWNRDKDGPVDDSSLAARLMHIAPNSPEMYISVAVQDVMFDTRTPEGNTRRLFIEKFQTFPDPDKSPTVQLRHFIDGMHEFIMEKRGASLAAEFVVASSANGNGKLNFRVAGTYSIDGTPRRKSKTDTDVYKHPSMGTDSATPWWTVNSEETVLSISFLIFSAVEQSMFIPLQEKVISSLPSAGNKVRRATAGPCVVSFFLILVYYFIQNDEKMAVKKLRFLRSRTQGEWLIPPEFQSDQNWENAMFELAGIERNPTPSMKLYALLRCAKAIYTEFKEFVIPRIAFEKPDKASETVLGADDFLPIFIYVLCHSDINTPLLNKELLWSLCHPDQLYGESGYYLTVYESALEFVENIEVDEEDLAAVELDDFDAETSRRTISVNFDPSDLKNVQKSAASVITNKIGTKIRRMSVNVIERVKGPKAAAGSGGASVAEGDAASELGAASLHDEFLVAEEDAAVEEGGGGRQESSASEAPVINPLQHSTNDD
jgi:hypothetical protein